MTIIVSKHIEGHYIVELAEPEETWQKILAGKLLCDETTVLSLAIGRGLVNLMCMFGRPQTPEDVT